MKKRTMLCTVCVMALMAGCNHMGQTSTGTASDSTQTSAEKPIDRMHSAEYIILRLDTIYQTRIDSTCCSQRYLAVYGEAENISRRDGTIFLDADHWVMGQDAPEDWSYSIEGVKDITDSTALATVLIHSFDDQQVNLDLVFERGNWYVDNFRYLYEGADYDSDGNKIPDSDGIKEYNELKSIREFIRNDLSEDSLDRLGLENLPRRNSLKEAEEMTEQAKKRLEKYAE